MTHIEKIAWTLHALTEEETGTPGCCLVCEYMKGDSLYHLKCSCELLKVKISEFVGLGCPPAHCPIRGKYIEQFVDLKELENETNPSR